MSLQMPKMPWPVTCLGMLLCLSVWASSALGQSQPCTVSGNTDHWYSPAKHNEADRVPHQCHSCLDAGNASHAACWVFGFLQSEACAAGHCRTEQGAFELDHADGVALQQSLRYQSAWTYWLDARSNCWFLLWALDPVIGIEDAAHQEKNNYWQLAFEAAQTKIDPPIAPNELALMIHSAKTRSQHQLHIHIGRLKADWRQTIDQLAQKPEQRMIARLSGRDHQMIFLPDKFPGSPLKDVAVFETVQALLPLGAAEMPNQTVMVTRAADQTGSWVIVNEQMTRSDMVFRLASGCQLRPSQ